MVTAEGALLWEPSADRVKHARVTAFAHWLGEHRGLQFADAAAMWQWSVDDLHTFWSALWEFCGVRAHAPYDAVLADDSMPGARWFPGAQLSYAEHALAWTGSDPALVFRRED